MERAIRTTRLIRFANYEADLDAGELRRNDRKLKLSGQPFQVLAILLERAGEVVTREELQKRLWPDSFVDFDHNLNTAVNRIREVLGDSAETPRFVETVPRRGYRFIASVEENAAAEATAGLPTTVPQSPRRKALRLAAWISVACALIGAAMWFLSRHRPSVEIVSQRPLTRLTFDVGMQKEATWSPDGRFIAYSSDRGGKFDIWVQALSGGDPVQLTHSPGNNWQPDWSPNGRYIAYRSEEGDGGIFIIPAVTGEGGGKRIASFGRHPRWSPDGSRILFRTRFTTGLEYNDHLYVAELDGSPPHEVLADFLSQHKLWEGSAAWHPDGRITLFVDDIGPGPVFWTLPITSGAAVKMEIDPSVTSELQRELFDTARNEWSGDFTFAWAPSGKAIYFERAYRGNVNLWKLTVDPQTLCGTAIERVTTGAGMDVEPSVSRDGKRMVFTAQPTVVRPWLVPVDASTGRTTGNPQPLTSPGMGGLVQTLSRDGTLAFFVVRHGNFELWEKPVAGGEESPIITGDYERSYPQWSPDGRSLAYSREKFPSYEQQLVRWSTETRTEEPLTGATSDFTRRICDWTPDGNGLLVSQVHNEGKNTVWRKEIWLFPLTAAPHAETAARKIISDPNYDFWQSRYSPNGRWIVFGARANPPTGAESALYVMPAGGGPWTRITEGRNWDHEPAWAPDGKILYFFSRRDGYFNVWGIHFDPEKGKPIGQPFQVTSFEHPALMSTEWDNITGFSVQQDKMVLTMTEESGSLWLLDNVDN